MSVVVNFRREDLSPEDVLRYFFHEVNESHQLEISLTDPRIKSHLTALKSLANVYIRTASPVVLGIPPEYCDPVNRELNHLRARFLAETVLGILVEEGVVRLKS